MAVNFDYQAYSFESFVQMKEKTKPMVNILPGIPSHFLWIIYINKYINETHY